VNFNPVARHVDFELLKSSEQVRLEVAHPRSLLHSVVGRRQNLIATLHQRYSGPPSNVCTGSTRPTRAPSRIAPVYVMSVAVDGCAVPGHTTARRVC
jgi:hypothetical protein